MSGTSYAKGITAEDLRTFLESWSRFAAEGEEIKRMLIEDKDIIFGKDAIPFSWCHLYELPIKEHMVATMAGFLLDKKFLDILKNMVESPSQIAALPDIFKQIDGYLDASGMPSKEEAMEVLPMLGAFLGVGFSAYNSLRCVLYHGCFLNELIQRIPLGDDKALFDAVRIDPTVIGCKPVIARVSKATLLQDVKFFAKLKAALIGKIAKREQANFQKMRMVLEIIHEAGGVRLNDQHLHQLFVEELNLYTSNVKGGGSDKALRKFADTYMKKMATT
ncbi:MAG: hypothetical protein ACOY3V_00005 [Pseudomonadota bacterium]